MFEGARRQQLSLLNTLSEKKKNAGLHFIFLKLSYNYSNIFQVFRVLNTCLLDLNTLDQIDTFFF